jgi:hypothetical protein
MWLSGEILFDRDDFQALKGSTRVQLSRERLQCEASIESLSDLIKRVGNPAPESVLDAMKASRNRIESINELLRQLDIEEAAG